MSQTHRASEGDQPIPEDREVREYAGYLLQIAARYREAALDEGLAALGLNATRCRVLGIIRRLKSCTMGELSFFSTVDRTTLTRVVDQLTSIGLVERGATPGDRRKVILTLTAKGVRLHQRSLGIIREVNQGVFADIPEDRLRAATLVLRAAIGSVVADPHELKMLLTFSRATEGEAHQP
jgi:DNA-binding MarR family transcriptional regulator